MLRHTRSKTAQDVLLQNNEHKGVAVTLLCSGQHPTNTDYFYAPLCFLADRDTSVSFLMQKYCCSCFIYSLFIFCPENELRPSQKKVYQLCLAYTEYFQQRG